MSEFPEQQGPPPPGPLALVDLSDPRAVPVMQSVRQMVASLADPATALRRARDAARASLELIGSDSMGSDFGCTGEGVRALERLPRDRPVWIVGDVRGDAVALASVLAFIDASDAGDRKAAMVFLGDWTGGVGGDAACAALVLERFVAAPERTILLRGDREWSAPLPIEMPSGIRMMPHAPALASAHEDTCDAIETLTDRLPSMALLPDGLALVHGSLPRPSRLTNLATLNDLATAAPALRDCVLGRVHLREMRVQSGDRESGVLLGVEDFEQSMRMLSALGGRPIQRVVRGQDAAPEGFRWFKAYGSGVLLTLTTMADQLRETMGAGRRRPCIARLKSGAIRVVRLQVPDEVVLLGDQLFRRDARVAADATSVVPARHPETQIAHRAPAVAPASAPTPSVVAPAGSASAGRPASRTLDPDPAAAARKGPEAARMLFDRGVRLLQARAWAGARDAFRTASVEPDMQEACALNESVACMWLGPSGHQDALAKLRALRQLHPRDPAVLLNMGIAFLVCERNPSEAMRALRAAVDASADLTDAWWALGLAAAMRSDASAAASAFNLAAEGGCALPVPGSLHGLIPARELGPVLEALRGLARHKPRPEAPPVPIHA